MNIKIDNKGKIENTEIKLIWPITYIHTLNPYWLHHIFPSYLI
jgi:hypothetical protein